MSNEENKIKEEEKVEIKEIKEINEENIDNETKIEKKIGTFGNFVLLVFVILIIGTGILVYYLVHNAKNDLEASYNNVIAETSNMLNSFNTVEDDVEPDTIANIIDSVLGNTISNTATGTEPVNTVTASEVKTLNEKIIVLYNGLILDTSTMGVKDLKYIDKTDINKDKYVITYYNYDNFALTGSALGKLSDEVYEGVLQVENVGKIAISEKFNCIPREIQVVNSIPSVVNDNNDLSQYDTTKTIMVDLDGNGTNENILILSNRQKGYSKISLVDYQGTLVADLAYIEKSNWSAATTEDYYLTIENIEILDIDNDGVMELILELPTYEGAPEISLIKYKNGELQGEKDYEVSLEP